MAGKVIWYGERLLAEIRGATPEALIAGAEELLKAAQAKAPRRSGDLIASGYISAKGRSTYKNSKIHNKETKPQNDNQVVVGFAAFYARYIELGTSKRSAHPYLRPALDEMKDQIGATIVEKIGRKLK